MVFRRALESDYLVLAMCAALVAISLPTTPGFGTVRNLQIVLAVASPLLLFALGQMLVMLCGGIDLSMTAVAAVCSVCGAWLISDEKSLLAGSALATPAVFIAMPLLGGAMGAVNGLSVTQLRMPPFITTLTTMMFLYGFATWLTQSDNIAGLPTSFIVVGGNLWITLGLALGVSATVGWVLVRSKYGRWVYAVGQNIQTATVSGVPAQVTIVSTYVSAGTLAGVAAFIYTAQIETGSPVLAKNQLLDIIGAVVIGGTSLFGGRGKVRWTIGGVLFISLLDNVLNLNNLSHFTVMMAKGVIILLAAWADSLRHQWSAAS